MLRSKIASVGRVKFRSRILLVVEVMTPQKGSAMHLVTGGECLFGSQDRQEAVARC